MDEDKSIDAIGISSNVKSDFELKNEMIRFVAEENKAHFKSQQIDDAELDLNERIGILEDVLKRSHATFLSRFGPFLNPEHYLYFEHQHYHPEEKYEIQHYLDDLRQIHQKYDVALRNRRYDALQKLIKDGSYFSEIEMMKREPLLYEQLIGQYLTEKEIRTRDHVGEEAPSFLNVLLDGIDKDHVNDLRRKQESEEKHDDNEHDDDDDDDTSESGTNFNRSFSCGHPEDSDEEKFPKNPPSFRKKWGEFEDEPSAHPHDAPPKPPKKDIKEIKRISAVERQLLRDEFFSIMYSKFLSGFDKNFDYTKVDHNENFDNLAIRAQDEEDKYFDEEEATTLNSPAPATKELNDESQDPLDVYMKKLKDENITTSKNVNADTN